MGTQGPRWVLPAKERAQGQNIRPGWSGRYHQSATNRVATIRKAGEVAPWCEIGMPDAEFPPLMWEPETRHGCRSSARPSPPLFTRHLFGTSEMGHLRDVGLANYGQKSLPGVSHVYVSHVYIYNFVICYAASFSCQLPLFSKRGVKSAVSFLDTVRI